MSINQFANRLPGVKNNHYLKAYQGAVDNTGGLSEVKAVRDHYIVLCSNERGESAVNARLQRLYDRPLASWTPSKDNNSSRRSDEDSTEPRQQEQQLQARRGSAISEGASSFAGSVVYSESASVASKKGRRGRAVQRRVSLLEEPIGPTERGFDAVGEILAEVRPGLLDGAAQAVGGFATSGERSTVVDKVLYHVWEHSQQARMLVEGFRRVWQTIFELRSDIRAPYAALIQHHGLLVTATPFIPLLQDRPLEPTPPMVNHLLQRLKIGLRNHSKQGLSAYVGRDSRIYTLTIENVFPHQFDATLDLATGGVRRNLVRMELTKTIPQPYPEDFVSHVRQHFIPVVGTLLLKDVTALRSATPQDIVASRIISTRMHEVGVNMRFVYVLYKYLETVGKDPGPDAQANSLLKSSILMEMSVRAVRHFYRAESATSAAGTEVERLNRLCSLVNSMDASVWKSNIEPYVKKKYDVPKHVDIAVKGGPVACLAAESLGGLLDQRAMRVTAMKPYHSADSMFRPSLPLRLWVDEDQAKAVSLWEDSYASIIANTTSRNLVWQVEFQRHIVLAAMMGWVHAKKQLATFFQFLVKMSDEKQTGLSVVVGLSIACDCMDALGAGPKETKPVRDQLWNIVGGLGLEGFDNIHIAYRHVTTTYSMTSGQTEHLHEAIRCRNNVPHITRCATLNYYQQHHELCVHCFRYYAKKKDTVALKSLVDEAVKAKKSAGRAAGSESGPGVMKELDRAMCDKILEAKLVTSTLTKPAEITAATELLRTVFLAAKASLGVEDDTTRDAILLLVDHLFAFNKDVDDEMQALLIEVGMGGVLVARILEPDETVARREVLLEVGRNKLELQAEVEVGQLRAEYHDQLVQPYTNFAATLQELHQEQLYVFEDEYDGRIDIVQQADTEMVVGMLVFLDVQESFGRASIAFATEVEDFEVAHGAAATELLCEALVPMLGLVTEGLLEPSVRCVVDMEEGVERCSVLEEAAARGALTLEEWRSYTSIELKMKRDVLAMEFDMLVETIASTEEAHRLDIVAEGEISFLTEIEITFARGELEVDEVLDCIGLLCHSEELARQHTQCYVHPAMLLEVCEGEEAAARDNLDAAAVAPYVDIAATDEHEKRLHIETEMDSAFVNLFVQNEAIMRAALSDHRLFGLFDAATQCWLEFYWAAQCSDRVSVLQEQCSLHGVVIQAEAATNRLGVALQSEEAARSVVLCEHIAASLEHLRMAEEFGRLSTIMESEASEQSVIATIEADQRGTIAAEEGTAVVELDAEHAVVQRLVASVVLQDTANAAALSLWDEETAAFVLCSSAAFVEQHSVTYDATLYEERNERSSLRTAMENKIDLMKLQRRWDDYSGWLAGFEFGASSGFYHSECFRSCKIFYLQHDEWTTLTRTCADTAATIASFDLHMEQLRGLMLAHRTAVHAVSEATESFYAKRVVPYVRQLASFVPVGSSSLLFEEIYRRDQLEVTRFNDLALLQTRLNRGASAIARFDVNLEKLFGIALRHAELTQAWFDATSLFVPHVVLPYERGLREFVLLGSGGLLKQEDYDRQVILADEDSRQRKIIWDFDWQGKLIMRYCQAVDEINTAANNAVVRQAAVHSSAEHFYSSVAVAYIRGVWVLWGPATETVTKEELLGRTILNNEERTGFEAVVDDCRQKTVAVARYAAQLKALRGILAGHRAALQSFFDTLKEFRTKVMAPYARRLWRYWGVATKSLPKREMFTRSTLCVAEQRSFDTILSSADDQLFVASRFQQWFTATSGAVAEHERVVTVMHATSSLFYTTAVTPYTTAARHLLRLMASGVQYLELYMRGSIEVEWGRDLVVLADYCREGTRVALFLGSQRDALTAACATVAAVADDYHTLLQVADDYVGGLQQCGMLIQDCFENQASFDLGYDDSLALAVGELFGRSTIAAEEDTTFAMTILVPQHDRQVGAHRTAVERQLRRGIVTSGVHTEHNELVARGVVAAEEQAERGRLYTVVWGGAQLQRRYECWMRDASANCQAAVDYKYGVARNDYYLTFVVAARFDRYHAILSRLYDAHAEAKLRRVNDIYVFHVHVAFPYWEALDALYAQHQPFEHKLFLFDESWRPDLRRDKKSKLRADVDKGNRVAAMRYAAGMLLLRMTDDENDAVADEQDPYGVNRSLRFDESFESERRRSRRDGSIPKLPPINPSSSPTDPYQGPYSVNTATRRRQPRRMVQRKQPKQTTTSASRGSLPSLDKNGRS